MASIPTRPVTFGVTFPVTFPVSDPLQEFSSAGYPLNDNGTNAADFNAVLLPTISPARNRATYTLTATSQVLVATPASLTEAPGLVTLVADTPLVCGFTIHSVPSAGDIDTFTFQIYNYQGSGSVLFNAVVTKNTGATTGTIQAQYGTFPPSVANFGTAYTGDLTDAKVAFQLTLSGGDLSAKFFVNGTLLGTSTPIATDGGVFADLLINDGTGAGGVVDISIVPTVASGLNSAYGDLAVGSLDMVGHSIFTPASVAGISDYWMNDDRTRLWTTSALSTNVSAAGDPVGGWRGQLNARTLTQATAGTCLQYELDGILIDSTAAFKNINQTVSLGANDPFFLWIRQSCSSVNAADFGLSASTGTVRSGIAGAFGNDYRVRVKFDGTTGNYDTDTDETGDRFIAVWYDGTNGYGMNDAGVVGSVIIGTNASTITRLWVNALLATAAVTKVKNMGFGTSAVTPAVAEQVRQWSKSRP